MQSATLLKRRVSSQQKLSAKWSRKGSPSEGLECFPVKGNAEDLSYHPVQPPPEAQRVLLQTRTRLPSETTPCLPQFTLSSSYRRTDVRGGGRDGNLKPWDTPATLIDLTGSKGKGGLEDQQSRGFPRPEISAFELHIDPLQVEQIAHLWLCLQTSKWMWIYKERSLND